MSDHLDPLEELLREGLRNELPETLTDRLLSLSSWVDPDAVVSEWAILETAVRDPRTRLVECSLREELSVSLSITPGASQVNVDFAIEWVGDGPAPAVRLETAAGGVVEPLDQAGSLIYPIGTFVRFVELDKPPKKVSAFIQLG